MSRKIRIATRESPLAMWQARHVRDLLVSCQPDITVEIVGMTTRGDRDKQSPLGKIGGKGVFVKELESALLRGEVDIAVHSMKDVPSVLPDGLVIGGICERADPRDAFVSARYASLAEVPPGGRIGSSSLRRRFQLRAVYPALDYVELRGNVETRLRKLDEGEYEGIILAAAGLARLGLGERISELIPAGVCIPSAGQGAVGIESRRDDEEMNHLLNSVSHTETALCVTCERHVTTALGATCNLPIAVFASIVQERFVMQSFVSDEEGKVVLDVRHDGAVSEAMEIAVKVAGTLLERGAGDLIHGTT